jgi:hypothetical protein
MPRIKKEGWRKEGQMSADVEIEVGASILTQSLGEICGLKVHHPIEIETLLKKMKIYTSCSDTVFKEYLDYAIEQGWIEYGNQGTTAYLTDKGLIEAKGKNG